MREALIVFVDAYPWYRLSSSSFVGKFPVRARLIPGLGYSVNCQAELFTGKTPDQLGYWCEWTLAPTLSPFASASAFMKLMRPLERYRLTDRGAHRIINRVSKVQTKGIPFDTLPHFAPTAPSVFARDYPQWSVLSAGKFSKFTYLDYRNVPPREFDSDICKRARAAFRSEQGGRFFVALGELDFVGHFSGPSSVAYDDAQRRTDRLIGDLIADFQACYPDGAIIVLSDHGMAEVVSTIDLDLERVFGPPRATRYRYFLEATILRVWCFDSRLQHEIEAFLRTQKGTIVLSASDRAALSITSAAFGDVVATVDEGLMWVPSFWGKGPSRGMHGYLPKYEQQAGIYCGINVSELPASLQNTQVAGVLASVIGSTVPAVA